MSAPIEAQSLSSLSHLFANPPQYPRNPTHKVNEPLVLYIVRVPGSKDVFLSPIKPPTKSSISLGAIQSSLYYFHVPTKEDEVVKSAIEEQRSSDEERRPSVTITRKPLPPTQFAKHPLPPVPNTAEYDPDTRPPVPFRSSQDGFAVPVSEPQLRVDTNPSAGLYRKPVYGGQPVAPSKLYDPAGDYALSPSGYERHSNQWSSDTTHGQAYSPPKTGHNTSSCPPSAQSAAHSSPNRLDYHEPSHLETTHRIDPRLQSVTIIRRDPASGSQWNIGTITLLEPTFSGSNIRPVSVELTTPGYGRFTKNGDSPRPESAGSDAASLRRAMESAHISPVSAVTADTSLAPFQRTVDFRKMRLADLRRTVYQRTNSADSITKMDPNKPRIEKNVLAFTSPWHGTCTFVNAIDGKTLKLKHTISNLSSTGEGATANIAELRFNLPWSLLSNVKDSQNKRTDPEPDKLPIPHLLDSRKENFRKSFQQIKNKSRESFQRHRSSNNIPRDEDALRDLSNIHTPTTNNLNDYSNRHPIINTAGTERPSLSPSTNEHSYSISSVNPSSEDNNEDEQHRISLKLGRERAGGGFRGNSAKLGKLIIMDEGLKMCDLVVGATMGVWWQHYEV